MARFAGGRGLVRAPADICVLMGSVMAAAFVMVVSCRLKSISNRYLPHQRELESLRSKLADPLQ